MPYTTAEIFKLACLLSDDELQNICLCYFTVIYDEFTGGQNRSHRIRLLIGYVIRSQTDITTLLGAIREINQSLHEDFINRSDRFRSYSGRSYFPEVLNFDLSNMVEDALDEILNHSGLIGLSIHCQDDILIRHFCSRLKKSLKTSNVIIHPLIRYSPNILPLASIINSIDKCRCSLKTNNIIFPVIIDGKIISEMEIVNFWTEIKRIFKDKLDRNLIITIGITQYDSIPPDIFPLPHFQVRKAHIFDWIYDITSVLHNKYPFDGWDDVDILDSWVENMMQSYVLNTNLNVDLLYKHLDAILYDVNLLEQGLSISPQDFLQRLYPELYT